MLRWMWKHYLVPKHRHRSARRDSSSAVIKSIRSNHRTANLWIMHTLYNTLHLFKSSTGSSSSQSNTKSLKAPRQSGWVQMRPVDFNPQPIVGLRCLRAAIHIYSWSGTHVLPKFITMNIPLVSYSRTISVPHLVHISVKIFPCNSDKDSRGKPLYYMSWMVHDVYIPMFVHIWIDTILHHLVMRKRHILLCADRQHFE